MKVSVVISAYNSEATIQTTLDSVLAQTRRPDEILVMDDGSTDQTASFLRDYEPNVKVFCQPNRGVSAARNALIAQARGDLVAFLDSDDLLHPRYLEVQCNIFERYPSAVAFFTGHANFVGETDYQWITDPFEDPSKIEIIPSLEFLERYNAAPGPFMCMSHCCVPNRVLKTLGDEPFKMRMAEDLYFFNLVAPSGPIVFVPKPLAAYRIREGSLSSDRLKLTEAEVRAFEILTEFYGGLSNVALIKSFRRSFASKRRLYAKVLLGSGLISAARSQLVSSLGVTANPASIVKSLGLLFLSYLPKALQPSWPPPHRVWAPAEQAAGTKSSQEKA
jgi:glycosyltransferase involved in cell wall biosynthesis